MKYLFVAGCPRSGTTALVKILNSHYQIILGMERFKYVKKKITPNHFTKTNFLALHKQETNIFEKNRDNSYEEIDRKFQNNKIEIIGDKYPQYYTQLEYLKTTFDPCQFLFLFRDSYEVASSFNVRAENKKDHWPAKNDFRAAVHHWNRSLKKLHEYTKKNSDKDFYIVRYEWLYAGNITYFETILNFLGISMTEEMYQKFETMTSNWETMKCKELHLTDEMREYISTNKDSALEKWCTDLSANQFIENMSNNTSSLLKQNGRHDINLLHLAAHKNLQQLTQLNSVLKEKNREISNLQQQLIQSNERIQQLNQTLENRDKEILDIQQQLFQSYQNLIAWIEQLDSLITSIVSSNRWKLGNTVYRIYKKILFRKIDTTPQEHQSKIMDNFQNWKSNNLN